MRILLSNLSKVLSFIIKKWADLNTNHSKRNRIFSILLMGNVYVKHAIVVESYVNLGRHKCPDPIKKGDFHSSYNADYPKY